METFWIVINLLATVEGWWSILRITGLPWLASGLLRIGGQRVKGSGFRFYFSRPALEQRNKKLGQLFTDTKWVDALWVKGEKFYDANENIHAVKRLILPNPDSNSLRLFANSVDQEALKEIIKAVTQKATKAGAQVRWCKEFYCTSINLVDTGRNNGWVHVEVVLPYSRPEDRPSFTIEKSRSPDCVLEFQRIFNEIWDKSDEQKLGE